MTLPRRLGISILAAGLLAGCSVRAPLKIQTLDVPAGGSISAAVHQAREARSHGANVVRIILHAGIYSLDDPLELTAKDSSLFILAAPREKPIISGGTVIGGWKTSKENPNIWQARLEDVRSGNWNFHELFVNGARRDRPRLPETGYFHAIGKSVPGHPTEMRFQPGDIKSEWADCGDAELVLYSAWAESRNQIRNVDASRGIVSVSGQVFPNESENNPRYFIDNASIPLRPGQWRLDRRTGVLSYWPEAGEDVPHSIIIAPHLYDLVQIRGNDSHRVRDITFRGITFSDAGWRLDGGADMDIQGAVEVPGAVRAEFATHCVFDHCAFERLGGYAIELGSGCVRCRIAACDMHDLGAGGIRVGGTDADDAYFHPCEKNSIIDNHIHDIGRVNAPAVGIFILLSSQNEIGHNEIDHTYYTGVSVGWSWGYHKTYCDKNIVEFNHIHDIGRGLLSDMGGVYTLGLQPGAVVRNNLIHDVSIHTYGGWGLYTDEGSSGITLESNIVYRCESAGFHQHYGESNVIRNNIFALSQLAQLAHTRPEKHVSFIFTNNIVYFDSGDLFAGRWQNDEVMDHNIYFDTRTNAAGQKSRSAFRAWQKRGHDLHSLFVDPRFVNPRHGNFHLKKNSPALARGFGRINLRHPGPRVKPGP